MNVFIRGIILTVLLVALGASSAMAALLFEPPHNRFACANCHYAGSTFNSTGFTNFCNTCHNPVAGSVAQLHSFADKDASNIFNNVTSKRTGTIWQTSHNWGGGLVVPRAGAVAPPAGSPLNYAPLIGLSCDRCHAMHGPVPQVSTASLPSFLKVTKDMDTICFECHSPRKTTDHKTGSHPVTMTYTTAIKKFARYTSIFYTTPVNANPANTSSAMKLSNGTLLCSTCHGVHWTDSSSATFDNASAAIGKSSFGSGSLVPGDGFILRTDRRGAAANNVNLCTNCHKGKYAHNVKSQNIQCGDCHGGHVDEADGSTPNVWLVNRYMVYSTGTYKLDNRLAGKQTIFTSVVRKNYRDANNTGVCQSCHAIPNTVAEHSQPNANCNLCHYHSNPKGSFAAENCNGCHGQPPTTDAAGGPTGSAGTYFATTAIQESRSPHGTHAASTGYGFACIECHQSSTNVHNDGNYQNVLNLNTGGTAGIIASYANPATPTYNPAANARNCSNLYCHSNGAPRTAAALDGPLTPAAAVGWVNGKGTFATANCASCHGNSSSLATNAHAKHVSPNAGKNYACGICHSATVAFNKYTSILDRTKHVNKLKDVSFAGTLAAGTTFNAAVGAATCSANYCHSNGKGTFATPSWTNAASGACGTCHLATGPANPIATGAHFAHFTTVYGPKKHSAQSSCLLCHGTGWTELGATHVTGTVNVDTASTTADTCSACHPNGTAATVNASWAANGFRVNCNDCHTGATMSVIGGKTAANKTIILNSLHGKPDAANAAMTCNRCHNNNAPHIGNVVANMRLTNTANDNTNCTDCHKDLSPSTNVVRASFRNMSTHISVYGGKQDPNFLCRACHDPHGSTNLKMIRTDIYKYTTWAKNSTNWVVTFTNRTSTSGINGYVNTRTNRGLCQICHTKTKYWKSGKVETTHYTSNCYMCHAHNAAGGAFKPSGDCNACHGYPPIPKTLGLVLRSTIATQGNYSSARFEDYSGGGGAHAIPAHIKPNAKPSEGFANCTMCHNNGSSAHKMTTPIKNNISNVTVVLDQKLRFNNAKQAWYSGSRLVYPGNVTGKCSNVECHFQYPPKWSKDR